MTTLLLGPDSEGMLKIGRHLAKLWSRIQWHLVWLTVADGWFFAPAYTYVMERFRWSDKPMSDWVSPLEFVELVNELHRLVLLLFLSHSLHCTWPRLLPPACDWIHTTHTTTTHQSWPPLDLASAPPTGLWLDSHYTHNNHNTDLI